MQRVVSNGRPPGVVRELGPVPGNVLFQRGVGLAGVAAQGTACSARSASVDGGSKVRGECTSVERVLSALRQSRRVASESGASEFSVGCAGSVELERSVASAFLSVASQSASREYRLADPMSPAGFLPRILRALVSRSVAAKVSRGRQWRAGRVVGRSSVPSSELFVPVASCRVASSELRHVGAESVSVASVASQSREFGSVASELSESCERLRRARVIH
jgi:hypothetical protein